MSPVAKGFVYAIACAVVTLWLRLPDPAVLVVSGIGGIAGALD